MRWPAISGQLKGLQAVPAEEPHERESGVGVAFSLPTLPAFGAPREELCSQPPAGESISLFPEFRSRDRDIASRFGPWPDEPER